MFPSRVVSCHERIMSIMSNTFLSTCTPSAATFSVTFWSHTLHFFGIRRGMSHSGNRFSLMCVWVNNMGGVRIAFDHLHACADVSNIITIIIHLRKRRCILFPSRGYFFNATPGMARLSGSWKCSIRSLDSFCKALTALPESLITFARWLLKDFAYLSFTDFESSYFTHLFGELEWIAFILWLSSSWAYCRAFSIGYGVFLFMQIWLALLIWARRSRFDNYLVVLVSTVEYNFFASASAVIRFKSVVVLLADLMSIMLVIPIRWVLPLSSSLHRLVSPLPILLSLLDNALILFNFFLGHYLGRKHMHEIVLAFWLQNLRVPGITTVEGFDIDLLDLVVAGLVHEVLDHHRRIEFAVVDWAVEFAYCIIWTKPMALGIDAVLSQSIFTSSWDYQISVFLCHSSLVFTIITSW